MKKSISIITLSLLVGGATLPVYAADATAAHGATTSGTDVASLQKQIAELNQKMAALECAQKNSEAVAKEAAVVAAKKEVQASGPIASSGPASQWPKGYIDVPGTNSAIKFGGFVKTDFIYEANGPTSNLSDDNSFDPATMPVKGTNADNISASKSGQTHAHARGTRLNMETVSNTEKGPLKTFVEFDFLGGSSNSTSYTPRLRHAYGEFQGFLAGQTFSNFLDMDAIGTQLDSNGIAATAPRQPLLKYTTNLNQAVTFAVSAEKPDSDYVDPTGASKDNDNDGVSGFPDLTGQLRWKGDMGHLSFRGLARQVQAKTPAGATGYTGTGFTGKSTGWGLGISGKLNFTNMTALFAQLNGGNAIGRYLFDGYQSFYYNAAKSHFATRRAYQGVFGIEQKLTETVRANIALAHEQISNPTAIMVQDGATGLYNRKVQKVIGNVIYSPIPKVDVGLEVSHGRREVLYLASGQSATTKAVSGTRVQAVALYKF